MSERSRGPEGASSPAPTRSNPSGGDDIYAAAAASAAGRNAKRSSGSASRSSTAGGAGSNGSNGSQPANKPAAAQKPAADKPAAGKAGQQAAAKPTDGGKPSPGTGADRAAGSQQSGASQSGTGQSGAGQSGAGQSGAGQSGAADQKSGAQGGWASRADGSGDSGDQAQSGDGPTSKLSAVASGLLSKVRGRSNDDPAPAAAAAGAQGAASTGAGSQESGARQSGAAQQSAAAKPSPAAKPAVVAQQTAPESRTETSKVVDAIKSDRGSDKPRPGAPRGTRKARLRLSRLDPWSVMKTAFLFSIAAGIVMVVAVYAVWLVIGSSGLFSSVDSIVGSVLQSPGDTTPFRIEDYVNTQKVMGVTAFLACIDVVIFTALATLASFLYNLAATMLGGLEVTLAED